MEHAQLAKFAATTNKNLMVETNFRILAINSTQNYIMDSFNREIGYVRTRLDIEMEYVNKRLDIARDYTGKTDTTRKSNKSKTPPKNNVRQPNIVPPDIMDIDTVTQLTTATGILKTDSSSTASKTKSKTVHFNEIADVKIIECRPYSRMKTAKTNKRKLDNSDNNRFGDRPL